MFQREDPCGVFRGRHCPAFISWHSSHPQLDLMLGTWIVEHQSSLQYSTVLCVIETCSSRPARRPRLLYKRFALAVVPRAYPQKCLSVSALTISTGSHHLRGAYCVHRSGLLFKERSVDLESDAKAHLSCSFKTLTRLSVESTSAAGEFASRRLTSDGVYCIKFKHTTKCRNDHC